MRNILYVFVIFVSFVPCRSTTVNWASIACLDNGVEYFTKLMQETVKDIETDVHWCNMKLDDINQFVNTSYYNWRVLGPINYTNGFTISLQGLGLVNLRTIFSTRSVNGSSYGNVYVEGTLRFSGLKVGFDIRADFENSGEHRFSSTHEYGTISMTCAINRNLNTNETTINTGNPSVPGVRDVTTEYFPMSNITEVVSRQFAPSVIAASINKWGKDIITPLMQKHVANIDFPEIRFDGCK